MDFLEIIHQKIETLASSFSLKEKRQLAEELTDRYRQRASSQFIKHEGHRLAYLLTRFPATFAVLEAVIIELKQRLPMLKLSSYTDWGCGPGLSLGMLKLGFPELETAAFLEKDLGWMHLGKQLLYELFPGVKQEWKGGDFTHPIETTADLSLFSYSLGELPLKTALQVAERAWSKTDKVLIIIEPGTPLGFSYLKELRDAFIKQGAFIIAPCAHQNQCPLAQDRNAWCHFSKRLNRTSQHRQIKSAELGYEDEKYSYLIIAKEPAASYQARLIHSVQKRSGHLTLELCTAQGMEKKVISKSHPLYKQAKKLDWGDAL